MIWLIDFTGWSFSNAVPIKTSREATSILQNHYPERLGAASLYNPPRIIEAFWKVVKLFLDPITFQKVNFVYPKNRESMENLRKHFDFDALPEDFGGNSKALYDHKEFYSLMSEDDIKAASVWGLNEKPSHASSENPIATATPES